MSKIKHAVKNIYIQYTAFFVFVSLFWVLQFVMSNKTMIWSVDGYLQWYPILAKFKTVVTSALSGGGLAMWQWDIGLGSDLISNFCLVLFDPFTYIALLFPTAQLDVAYSVIIVLKLFTAGFAVLKYLQYKKVSFNLCLIGAVSYAFCSWGIVCLRHDFFISQLILFPLIIWGIDKVWNRENPLLLIAGIFFSATISLYFTYMTALMVGVYVVVKYFKEKKEKSILDFIGTMIRLGIMSLVGALLAAPVIGAMLYALMNTSTESGSALQILPDATTWYRLLPGLAGNVDINANYSNVAVGAILLVVVPIFFMFKKNTTAMIMSIISIIVVIFPIFQSILNGLSYPAGRWCYGMCFFLVVAMVEAIPAMMEKKKKYNIAAIVFISAVSLATLIAYILEEEVVRENIASIVMDIVFAIAMVLIINAPKPYVQKEKILKFAVVLNVALFCFMNFSPYFKNEISIYLDRGQSYNAYKSSTLGEAKSIKDKDFYRVNSLWSPWADMQNGPTAHTAVNSNLFWGVPSTFEYLSTLDSDWIKYNVELGNSGGNFRRMTSLNNDSRARINYLQGVRYYISAEKKNNKLYDYDSYVDYGYEKVDGISSKVSVFKSKNETSLGYFFDSAVKSSDYLKLDNMSREQLLMNSVVVDDKDAKDFSNMLTTTSDVQYEDSHIVSHEIVDKHHVKLKDHKVVAKKDNSNIVIKPTQKMKDCEIYVRFKNFRKKGNGSFVVYLSRINDSGTKKLKAFMSAADENQGVQGVKDFIVNLGYTDGFDGNINVTFKTAGKYKYDDVEIVAVPVKRVDEQMATLSANRLIVDEKKNDTISGHITAPKDGMIYLSIIKNDGWTAYVDGQQVDTYQIDTAFTGIKVSAGEHQIKLVYHIVFYPYTYIMAIIGLIALLGIELKQIYSKKRKKK